MEQITEFAAVHESDVGYRREVKNSRQLSEAVQKCVDNPQRPLQARMNPSET
jgi:hypothetical protein